jgi:hypothetical protein
VCRGMRVFGCGTVEGGRRGKGRGRVDVDTTPRFIFYRDPSLSASRPDAMSRWDKTIRGATKSKHAPPKAKVSLWEMHR